MPPYSVNTCEATTEKACFAGGRNGGQRGGSISPNSESTPSLPWYPCLYCPPTSILGPPSVPPPPPLLPRHLGSGSKKHPQKGRSLPGGRKGVKFTGHMKGFRSSPGLRYVTQISPQEPQGKFTVGNR